MWFSAIQIVFIYDVILVNKKMTIICIYTDTVYTYTFSKIKIFLLNINIQICVKVSH